MKRVEFKEPTSKIKTSTVLQVALYMVLMFGVVVNTFSINNLALANKHGLLSSKVKVNTEEITKLENEVLRQNASIESLEVNPNELMKANVMIYTSVAKGSGSVIRVDKNYTYVLTAAHVVSSRVVGKNDKDVLDYMNVIDEDLTVFYGKDFKQSVKATVQKIDYDVDVAVLRIEKALDITPIKIAQVEPELGEVVWSLSNPGSLEGVINKGIFSNIEEDYSYVALGGFFGSSGGMCLNNRGEQIGVISTVVIAKVGSYSLSLTVYNGITRTKNLNKFLKGLV